jgi:uncharacterized membrane protein YdjX (TVP38/TMEM64 family)
MVHSQCDNIGDDLMQWARKLKEHDPVVVERQAVAENKKTWKFRLVLGFFAVAAACYAMKSHIFEDYLVTTFNGQKNSLTTLYINSPLMVTLIYVGIYILSTALTIPIAMPLALAGGVLFGFWYGTLIVSLSSTIGATLSFLAARHLCRDFVIRRFPSQLEAVNRQIEKDGAYYLFTVRLIPVFPFFLMNLLLGLTSMKTATYFWVSLVGMLAGTMVYVNAGVEIAKIDVHADVFSPSLVASFVAIGLAPIIVKKFSDRIRTGWLRKRLSLGTENSLNG